jgi:Pullulanase X25 domain/PEP-CTERM motif
LPAGSFNYKVAIDDSFTVNYGQNGVLNGPQIDLNLAAPTVVGFYFEPMFHNPTDNFNFLIVGATGGFQSELGCPTDYNPSCLQSWLQDPDGDGIYTYSTTGIPAGSYNFKFTLNESYDVNYGEGGVEGGVDIPLNLPSNNLLTTFTFNASTHTGTVFTPSAIPEPSTALLLGAGLVALMALRRRAQGGSTVPFRDQNLE